ncbi:MAG: hypothetical protein Q7R40_14455 [Phaeospirillum sp.]|nr:hypothetical protein [Phaeospirillum sp.]
MKAIPSSKTIRRRLDLLRHAMASASLEGVPIDEATQRWIDDFAHDRPFHSHTLSGANKNSETVNSFWHRNSLNYLRLQNPYLSGAVNSRWRKRAAEKIKW